MEETDWELLGQFARRGEALDRGLLRAVLAGALTQRGHAAIVVEDEIPYAKKASQRLAVLFVASIPWGLGFAAAAAVGLPLILCPLGSVLAFLAVGALVPDSGESGVVAFLLIAVWLVVAALEATRGRFVVFAVGFLAPMLLCLIYALGTRALRLRDAQDVALAIGGVIRAAPLVAPVVLLVLFLPALSANVWQVASDLDFTSLVVTGLLSVGLLFVVVRWQIGSQIDRVVFQRSEHLSRNAGRSELTRRHARVALPDNGVAILDGIDEDGLDTSWPNVGEEYAPYLSISENSVLRSPLTGRLALTVLVVGLLLTIYIYLLCSAVVSGDLAFQWTHGLAPSTEIAVAGHSVTLHGGAFLKLSALLGLAATATFLSFALIEERFATALTDALLRDPTDRYLVLALPYVQLREQAITERLEHKPSQEPASDAA